MRGSQVQGAAVARALADVWRGRGHVVRASVASRKKLYIHTYIYLKL